MWLVGCTSAPSLRGGLAQQTVTAALAHAIAIQSAAAADKSGAELADLLGAADDVVKQTFSECPSYDEAREVQVEHISLTPRVESTRKHIVVSASFCK